MIEFSVTIIALALVVGIYYLVQLIRTINVAIVKVEGTMERLESQIERVTWESTQLLQKTNTLAQDIQHKSDKLDTLFESVQSVGDTVSGVTSRIETEAMKHKNKLGSLIALTSFGIDAYHKWKEIRESKQSVKVKAF